MDFSKKIYGRGETPSSLIANNFGLMGIAKKYFWLKLGRIEEVNYDKLEYQVIWLDETGGRNNVPATFPYCGPAGCLGMLPEKGAIGIFAFYDETGLGTKGSPLLIGYTTSGLSTGLNHNVVKITPDSLSTDDVNEIQHRFRKLMEGDMIMTSPCGGCVFLNEDVEISDNLSDKIFVRSGDQSIIQNSISNFIFADGVSISSGHIIRNRLVLYDDEGNKIEGIPASQITLPNGQIITKIVPFGSDITYDSDYYTEFRVDVDEYGNGKLDYNDINSQGIISIRDPVVTFVLGNYVGADQKNDLTYGKILRPVLFSSPDDQEGNFSLTECVQNAGFDEPSVIGLSYALDFIKSGAFIGMDKEGHYYIRLSKTKSNPLGAGRSMSILADGNLKEIWGADSDKNNSWDLTTKGGIRWNVGKHNINGKSRSISISTSSSFYMEVGGKDDDDQAHFVRILGDSVEEISGDKKINVRNLTHRINGLKTENISGSSTTSVQGDLTQNVLGVSTEIAIKEKQCKFGSRKTTITSGNDETEILLGNITETFKAFGKRTTTFMLGGAIEQKILGTGTVKTSITTGSYKVEVNAGSIEIKTNAGVVTVKGTSVSIKGQIQVSIDSPLVRIGKNAPIGGVVAGLPGIPNHFDYTTGAPLKGSSKVSVA